MPPRPLLDPTTVADDHKLAAAVDQIIKTDPTAAALQGEILQLQDRLRAVVDDDGWAAFLALDAKTTERWSELALVLVRWAYEQGVNSCERRPR